MHYREASIALAAAAVLIIGAGYAGSANTAVRAAAGYDHLVFTSDRDGDRDVYAVDARGGRVAALTWNRVDDDVLAVAPTGEVLVYRLNGGVVASPDGRRERKLGLIRLDGVLSHDGSLFAIGRVDPVTETGHIVLVRVRGGRTRNLGTGGPEMFSRDGRYLAFANQRGPGLIDLRTGRRRSLPQPPEEYRWAPNLDWLAYEYDDYSPGRTQLVVMGGRSRGAKRTVTRGDLVWEWIGDERIGASRVKDGMQDLVVLDVARGTEHVLATQDPRREGGDMYRAEWSPKGDAVAYIKDGHILVVARVDDGASEVNVGPGYYYATLTWAPRGDRLAVASDTGLDVLDVDGTPTLRRVASGNLNSSVVWSPDERWLAVDASSGITIVPAAGDSPQAFVRVANPQDLHWARGRLPRAARTALRPPQLNTRTVRLHRALPSSGTLLTVRGSISALAQDGDRVAWVRRTSGPFASVVEVLDVRRATRTVIGGLKRSADALNPGLYPAAFALAGGRVALIDVSGGACGLSACYYDVFTASLDKRVLRGVGYSEHEHDTELPALAAGDGDTLVYETRYGGVSTIHRIAADGHVADVMEADSPTALAAAAGRIAVAEAGTRVSVLKAADGTLVSRFEINDAVRALALSPQRVAVLTRDRIELRDVRSGALTRSFRVADASGLSMDGAAVVYRTGRTIRLLNARTGRMSILAHVKYPTELSIERGRVAWAESTRTGERIRVLKVSAGTR